jgi:hypothetical protein
VAAGLLCLVLPAGLLLAVVLAACAAPVGPTDRTTTGGAAVRRVRFEEDRVTCYVVGAANGISCLRDAP